MTGSGSLTMSSGPRTSPAASPARASPWRRVTGGGPRDFALGNRDFQEQKNQMAILQFQSRPTDKFTIASSLTWEWGTGTRPNNECGVLSLCTNGIDTAPHYEQNPYYNQGQLKEVRTWQFKLQASYQFPWQILGSANFRWVSGRTGR